MKAKEKAVIENKIHNLKIEAAKLNVNVNQDKLSRRIEIFEEINRLNASIGKNKERAR